MWFTMNSVANPLVLISLYSALMREEYRQPNVAIPPAFVLFTVGAVFSCEVYNEND